MLDMPINSAIAIPQTGDKIMTSINGTIEAKGYALPQGAQGPVVNVEVSINHGETWTNAEILNANKEQSKWSWALSKARVKIEKGHKKHILSRATDAGGNIQDDTEGKWNLRGVAYNGYGETKDLTVL